MERVNRWMKIQLTIGVVLIGSLSSIESTTWADVVFTPPPETQPLSPKEYPQSAFGRDPAPPIVRQLDRRPAGLMFEDDGMMTGATTYTKRTETPGDASHSNQADPRNVRIQSSFGNAGSVANLVPDSKKGVQEVALIAGDLGYFPRTVFVTKGIPVRIYVTGASRSTLCIMMDSFNVRKQIRSKKIEEVTFTPKMSGKYRFYCPVNGMEGTLVVKESVSQY